MILSHEMDSPNIGPILYNPLHQILPYIYLVILYLIKVKKSKKIINYFILNTKKVKNTFFLALEIL